MFRVVLIEHGYASIETERRIIDAGQWPLSKALELCRDAEGILFRRIDVTREMIAAWRKCRVLVRYGVGTDNVDLQAATEANIIVGHVPAYCVDEVSSHAMALMLACARKIVSTHRRVERGSWDVHRDEPIYRIAGKTVGIVGFGTIGAAVARKLSGWEVTRLAADPFIEPDRAQELGVELVDFETLCRRSHLITLHAPLLPETRGLINAKSLALVPPGAILVNTARGGLVESHALLRALDSGQLATAGLDVFETEPLPAASPLRRHPHVVVTDHTAWYSEDSQQELQRTAAEELARVCQGGLPKSVANPEVIKRLGRITDWQPGDNMRWQLQRLRSLGAWQ
jgi:D-3-phosphoglycerate dehydrogenase / 2-oxoglutarate reductase